MAERIPLLAFTLTGPMGHFRKFYSNTSALTYPFPPPTTLRGLVAGLLGRRRDTYYEDLSSERLWIAVRMLAPVRIRTYTVNYLFTKNNALYDKGAGTQIPMGWVLPRPPARRLRYRVYVSTPDRSLWDALERTFSRRTFHWPPYLGITEALAWIESDLWIGEVSYAVHEEPVPLLTPVVQHPEMRLEPEPGIRLLLDRCTLDFLPRPYRAPRAVVHVVYEDTGKPFRAHLPYPVFTLPEEQGGYWAFFQDIRTVQRTQP